MVLDSAAHERLRAGWRGAALMAFVVGYFGLALLYLVGEGEVVAAWLPAAVAIGGALYLLVLSARSLTSARTRTMVSYVALALAASAGALLYVDGYVPEARSARPWWLWALTMLPLGVIVAATILGSALAWLRPESREMNLAGDKPVLSAKVSLIARRRADRRELLETVFHGFVTLLVELVALAAAFIFYLSKEARRAIERPVLDGVYNDQRSALAQSFNQALNMACEPPEPPTEMPAAAAVRQPAAAVRQPAVPGPAGEVTGQADAAAAGALRSACCAAGVPAAVAETVASVIRLAEDPYPERSETASQNRWVFRLAILYVGMAVVAFFVAYAINRLAGGPSVNIPSIVRYNVFLLAVALGLQVAFMFAITLRYIPIMPSLQWKQLRSAVNRELDRVSSPEPAQAVADADDEDLQVVPTNALWRNLWLVGFLLLAAASVWFAWRLKAFTQITFTQSVCIQSFFIAIIMTTMYFTLSRSVASDAQDSAMSSIARRLAVSIKDSDAAVAAARSQLNRTLDELDATAADLDERVRQLNAKTLRPFTTFAAVFVGALLLIVLATARRKALSGRFWVALLAVGLVGASTSVTVEYGFLQNVFRSYRPLDVSAVLNSAGSSARQSTQRHAEWFCAQGCPDEANPCCTDGPAACGETGIWARAELKL